MTNHHKLIKLPEVIQITSLSKSAIYGLAKSGKFPKPLKLSERSSAWLEQDIHEWIESKIIREG